MMVQRRHAEHPLLGQLERGHLDDDRQGFEDEQAAHQDEEDLLLGDHRHAADRGAERERADVAHEHLGRV
jgi:hypothetical protein